MQLDVLKKNIIDVQPLKMPLSVSDALVAFLGTQLEVLPIIYGSDLKALYFKDTIPLVISCRNGNACSKQIPTNTFKDIFYIDINLNADAVIESLKKGIEHETSMAILRDDVYIGMVTLKNVVSFVTEQKIKDAVTTNPLTGLPGNYSIKREFTRRDPKLEPFCVCYFDLSNFKAYNDNYGMVKGDEVIKFTASLLSNLCRDNFVGHVGGDDFISYLPTNTAKEILNEIVTEFDRGILGFYNESHKEQGYIIATDRDGIVKMFPIMTIIVAVVLVETARSFDYISGSLVGLKKKLKEESRKNGGSRYAFDERKISVPEWL